MTTFIHSFSSRHFLCIDHERYQNIFELKQDLFHSKGVPEESCFFICNGKLVEDDEPVRANNIYHTYLRLPGGKGGFGSMLRAIGAQIEKTTNHEACRDLSGRRMRDINNEKDLKDWLAKQAEREKEKEERRQERIARRRAMPNHKFDDPTYDQQRSLLAENLEDALLKGLQKSGMKPGTSATVTSDEAAMGKRKCEADSSSNGKKKKKDVEWLGIDIDNMSDLDSGDDEDQSNDAAGTSASPGETYSSNSRSSEDRLPSESTAVTSQADSSSQGAVANSSDQSPPQDDNISSTATTQSSDGQSSDKHIQKSHDNDNEKCETDSKGTGESENKQEEDKPFNLDDITSIEEMATFGLDILKAELMNRGLKCGGTLEQRAERLFSVKGLTPEQIDPALFAKSNGKNVKNKKK